MVSAQAQRTLVKSPPELWAELSDPAALARHLGELGEIRITRLQPEKKIEWASEQARGTVLIKPSGWGTKVTLTASGQPGAEHASAPQAVNQGDPAPEGDPRTAPHDDAPATAPAAAPRHPPAGIDRPSLPHAAEPQPAAASPVPARIRITGRVGSPPSAAPTPGGIGSPESAGAAAAGAPPATVPLAPAGTGAETAPPPQASPPAGAKADPEEGPAPEPAEQPASAEDPPTRRGLLARLWRRFHGVRPPVGSVAANPEQPPFANGEQGVPAAAPPGARPSPFAAAPSDTPGEEPHASVVPEPAPTPELPAGPQPQPVPEPLVQPPPKPLPETPATWARRQAEPVVPSAQAPEQRPAAGEQTAGEFKAEHVTAVLTSVLDRLGAAHHRPFSRA